MTIKQISANAITETKQYDWYKETWAFYAILLGNDLTRYPNAPGKLQDRINLRGN